MRPAGLPLMGALYDSIQARTHGLHGRRYIRWLAGHWQELMNEPLGRVSNLKEATGLEGPEL